MKTINIRCTLLDVGLFIGFGVFLFGCSTEISQYSPDQVINNALEETTEALAYYAEAEMTMETGDDIENMETKEWYNGDGKMRMEITDESGLTILVNDSKSVKTYEKEKNRAFIMSDPEVLAYNPPAPREQAEMLLDMIRDTHHIEEAGEEKVAGRDTFHLVAEPKEKSTLIGNQEIWVDKENWMVLKYVTEAGDNKIQFVYKKIEFDPIFEEKLFTLDLPDDVTIEDISGLHSSEEITLAEAADRFNDSFLVFQKEEWEMDTIEWFESSGEYPSKVVDLEYKKDGLPLLELGVSKVIDESTDLEDLELPGIEQVTVRNHKGEFIDGGDTRVLSWQEEGFTYTVSLYDPHFTLEELLSLADEMEFVKTDS
ncbi:LolA family protein [Virgibacillus sp. W0430]|uniref:LolA family protein n=1 Tax=Virgibacillus sp. W0430 TaxID=3391580 RepID=UPI003F477926